MERVASLHSARQRTLYWNTSLEKAFRLPLPHSTPKLAFTLALSNVMRDRPTTISRLEIRGRLAPLFLFAMADTNGSVVTKFVSPNGLAERAGLQAGDVLSAINGKHPRTVSEATDMLQRIAFGRRQSLPSTEPRKPNNFE